MKRLKIVFSLLAISAFLLSCADEDFTDPKASTKTGLNSPLFDANIILNANFSKANPSAVCTTAVGNVPATNYFDASLNNGVIGIKGSGNLTAATGTGFCAANDYCACTELQRLALTNPTVNNNNLVITGKVKMPNATASNNRVIFQRAFSGDFLPTPGNDTVLYQVMLTRNSDDACVYITRAINTTQGTKIYGGACVGGSSTPLEGVFGSGDDETDITIEFIRVDATKFKIKVSAADATGTTKSIEDEDDPSSNIGSGSGSKITVGSSNIVLGAVVNQIPTTAVNLVLFTNQGTGPTNAPFDPAKAPTVANLKITQ